MKFTETWDKHVTVGGVVLAALFEAIDQGLKTSPRIAARVPLFFESSLFHLLPLMFLVIAGIAWSKKILGGKPKSIEDATQIQTSTPPQGQYLNVEDFYRTYDNVLLVETEQYLRGLAEKYQPGQDRERFLIRSFASAALEYVFDLTYSNIWGTQIMVLEELNKNALTVNLVQAYYDVGVAVSPAHYQHQTFEEWLSFLFTWILARQDGMTIRITVRGQEFLKYLVQTGRSSGGRPN